MGLPSPYYRDEPNGITLYHANCTDLLETWQTRGGAVDVVITDPPYGIGYSHGGKSGVLARTSKFVGVKVAGDNRPFDPTPFLSWPCVLWGANNYNDKLPRGKRWLVWDKRDGLPCNDLSDCEMAYTSIDGTDRLMSCRWMGMIKDRERGQERIHPMQKPVCIMDWCLSFFPDAKTVLDPYCGSGATLVACLNRHLHGIGIEIEEAYCESAARRLEAEAKRYSLIDQPTVAVRQTELFPMLDAYSPTT